MNINKNKEDVPDKLYSELLKLLYRRARNIVKAVEELHRFWKEN